MNGLIYKFPSLLKYWFFFICLHFCLYTNAQTFVDFESGALFVNVNDIRNGKNGTLFSLKDDFKTPISPFLRLRIGFLLNEKNHFSILYAPLKIIETGKIDRDILYAGKYFRENIPIEVVYKFNSYRLTYNRRIINKNQFEFGVGFSLKIRDAGISLKNEEFSNESFGVGFVPLINLLANWDISQKLGVYFFGEGLVASRGRAIDISLSGRYNFTRNIKGNIGYRLLEGGTDGINRYNFIQLHFIFASLNYSFGKKD